MNLASNEQDEDENENEDFEGKNEQIKRLNLEQEIISAKDHQKRQDNFLPNVNIQTAAAEHEEDDEHRRLDSDLDVEEQSPASPSLNSFVVENKSVRPFIGRTETQMIRDNGATFANIAGEHLSFPSADALLFCLLSSAPSAY